MVVSDALVEGCAGAVGGCVATVATYPLMRMTTLQTLRVRDRANAAAIAAAASPKDAEAAAAPPPGADDKARSTLEQLRALAQAHGWRALFTGLSAALAGTTVSQGVYFYLYSLLRGAAVRRRGGAAGAADPRGAGLGVTESLLVASLAGMGNVLLTNPIWIVATRMQSHRHAERGGDVGAGGGPESACASSAPPPPGALAVARSVYAEFGPAGFWKGVAPSLAMVINPTIQYALYEWLAAGRARARRARRGAAADAARPSAAEVFALGALAKAGATVLTYPLLTVKTRMMAARRGDAGPAYGSLAEAVARIGREEGLAGYYRGVRPKLVQSVLAAALLFAAKEKIMDATRAALAGAALAAAAPSAAKGRGKGCA
jgi:adenine nucleotide transporter 17